jgi:hypothetical protein
VNLDDEPREGESVLDFLKRKASIKNSPQNDVLGLEHNGRAVIVSKENGVASEKLKIGSSSHVVNSFFESTEVHRPFSTTQGHINVIPLTPEARKRISRLKECIIVFPGRAEAKKAPLYNSSVGLKSAKAINVLEKQYDERESRAATTIQRCYRARFLKRVNAVVCIQNLWKRIAQRKRATL